MEKCVDASAILELLLSIRSIFGSLRGTPKAVHTPNYVQVSSAKPTVLGLQACALPGECRGTAKPGQNPEASYNDGYDLIRMLEGNG